MVQSVVDIHSSDPGRLVLHHAARDDQHALPALPAVHPPGLHRRLLPPEPHARRHQQQVHPDPPVLPGEEALGAAQEAWPGRRGGGQRGERHEGQADEQDIHGTV